MFVTILGKNNIPAEKQLGAVAHICKVFGIQMKADCSLKDIKNQLRINRICKRYTCGLYPNTHAVYIGNLPRSFTSFHVVTLINLLSDFDTSNSNFFIDMYYDSQNRSTGRCLIRFLNIKFIPTFFGDMQGLVDLDSNIIVKLDIGSVLSREKDALNPLYNPGKNTNRNLMQYILHQQLDFTNCYLPNNVDSNNGRNQDQGTETRQNCSTSVDALRIEQPVYIASNPQTSLRGVWIKVQGKRIPIKMMFGAAIHICKEFNIKLQKGSSLEVITKLLSDMAVGFKATLDRNLEDQINNSVRRTLGTKAVHIQNLPPSFTQFHVVALLILLSEFDPSHENFYIDMYQDAQNKNTGECLIRFLTNKHVAQVFMDMLALQGFKSQIEVKLDIGGAICAEKDQHNPLSNPKKKPNKNLRQWILQQEYDFSNCNVPETEDNTNEIEDDDDDVIEIKEKRDVIEICDSDDDIVVEDGKANNDVSVTSDSIEKEDEDNNDALDESDSGDDILEIRDKVNEIVEIQDSDEDTECREENQSESINKASIQVTKSVSKNDKHPNTSKTYNTTNELLDRTETINAKEAPSEPDLLFYEDKAGDSTISNAPETSESDVIFIEDKIGNNNTNTRRKDSSNTAVKYKVTPNAIDSRTIVSVTSLSKAKDINKIRSLIQQIKNIDESLQYELHTVKKDNKSTGEYLLRFRSAKDAIKVHYRLQGLKLRKLAMQVKLLDSQVTTFPKSNLNMCIPLVRKTPLTANDSHASKEVVSFPESNKNTVNPLVRKLPINATTNQAKRRKPDDLPTPRAADDFSLSFILPEERSNDSYGLSPEFLEKHGINVPLTTTVLVKNLHSTIEEKKLHEVFSLAGVIRKINKSFSDTLGHIARIEFDHPVEAVQAISLFHNQELYSQKITVEMDPSKENQPLPSGLCSVGRGLGKNGAPLRGVRNVIDLNDAKEALVDVGKVTKLPATDRTMPFNYSYIELNQPLIEYKRNIPAEDTNNEQDKDSDIFDGTSIQELSDALISQSLIPAGTNCKDLEDLLNVLKSNPPEKETEPMVVDDKDDNRNLPDAPPNSENNSSCQNIVSNMPYSTNRPPNSNINLVPDDVITNSRLANQMMSSNPSQANMTSSRPNIATPSSDINRNTPNMAVRPRVDDMMLRAALLYEDHPRPNLNRDSNLPPKKNSPLLATPNMSPQVQNQNTLPTKSKLMKQRYFSSNMPQDSNPLRPSDEGRHANTSELNQDVIHIRQPTRTPAQQQNSDNSQSESSRGQDNSKAKSGGGNKETDMLIFQNLPHCVSTEALSSKLREVGELLFCELTGRGRAVVRFKNANDAQRATQLFNGSKVEGQIIGVTKVFSKS